jgi:hypothetical protein
MKGNAMKSRAFVLIATSAVFFLAAAPHDLDISQRGAGRRSALSIGLHERNGGFRED